MISLNIEKTFGFISKEKVSAYEAEVKAAQEMLEKGTGKGNDFPQVFQHQLFQHHRPNKVGGTLPFLPFVGAAGVVVLIPGPRLRAVQMKSMAAISTI